MTSQVGILNLAFRDLGGQNISTFGENSKEGKLGIVYWDQVLIEAFEAHNWDFAKKWDNLAEDADFDIVDSRWSFAYQIPADFVRFSENEDLATEYVRRDDHIMTNENPYAVEYIYLQTDTSRYPGYFVKYLVSKLRVRFQIPLAKKGTKTVDWKTAEIFEEANAILIEAGQTQPQEEQQKRHTDATEPWLAVYDN